MFALPSRRRKPLGDGPSGPPYSEVRQMAWIDDKRVASVNRIQQVQQPVSTKDRRARLGKVHKIFCEDAEPDGDRRSRIWPRTRHHSMSLW